MRDLNKTTYLKWDGIGCPVDVQWTSTSSTPLSYPTQRQVQHSDKTCLPTALPSTILCPLPSAYTQEGRCVCPKARAWGLVFEEPGPWTFLIANMGLQPWSGPGVGRRETLKAKWHFYLGELTAELEPWGTPPQEHPQGRLLDQLCYQVHWAEVQTICLPRTTGCLPSKEMVGVAVRQSQPLPCPQLPPHPHDPTMVVSVSVCLPHALSWKIPGLCPCWPVYPWGPSPCLTLLMKAFVPVLFSCVFFQAALWDPLLWLPAPVPQACSSVSCFLSLKPGVMVSAPLQLIIVS